MFYFVSLFNIFYSVHILNYIYAWLTLDDIKLFYTLEMQQPLILLNNFKMTI